MEGRRIPRCMSTQHPDNVSIPFFAQDTVLEGEDEIQEAYYAFSHLGCDEQMWDCEGKEVDNYIIKKLLTKYPDYFAGQRLGRDVFITLRVPNPTVERAEAKILLETLESIPRSFDAAKLVYGDDTPPVFEVILPMTASAKCIDRVASYYRDFVVGKQDRPFSAGDITIAQWIGEFHPERIDVIPLFEDMEHMLGAHRLVQEYLRGKDIRRQRVFLARSDPAMNYGLIAAVVFNKIALRRLHVLSGETGVEILPIIGVGTAPFRGNLSPRTVPRITREYPSVYTFTIQSAFKYDYPPDEVRAAVRALHDRTPKAPPEIDEARCLAICERYVQEYQRQITELAPVINQVARYVPGRRKRKLHIGLFGYSRSLGATSLPRAITFNAALYSIGMPPELLGLSALSDDDLAFLRGVYVNLDDDLADAVRCLNLDAGFVPRELKDRLHDLAAEHAPDPQHAEMTARIARAARENDSHPIAEALVRAAHLRRFLG